MKLHRRTRSAFTIVEVMVALVVFVMMAVVLGASYVNILKAYEMAGKSSLRDEDVRFARQAVFTEPDRDTVEKGGSFDGQNNHKIRWTAAIESTDTADLFQVTFTCEISGQDLPKNEVIKETFRLLRPTWSKVDERDKLRAAAKDRFQKQLLKKS